MLEKNSIGEKIFVDVNKCLDETGVMMHGGTIVDAGIIDASKLTKTKRVKATLKCIRLRRAMDGTSE